MPSTGSATSRFRAVLSGALILAASTPALAGVIGRDDRQMLSRMASGDSADRRLAEAARASGLLTCDNGRFGSASLVLRGDVVVTAGHVFFGQMEAVRAGRVRCVYIPDGLPTSRRYEVDLSRIRLGAERVTGVNICSNGRDWAVLRLKEPVAGVVPYLPATRVATSGSPVAIVSHGGGSGALRGPGGHAGRCTVRDLVGPCRQTNVPLIFTDCDAEAGSSGGATLVEENGRWVLGGITRGASAQGGAAYARETAYHMAVPMAGPLLRAIREMAGP